MARSPKITYQLLQHWIEMGLGQGHGENYQPWLQIRRWNPSPESTQVHGRVPPYYRACHFFSRSEWLLALLFSWLGAEVREQLPAWPWPHPHPLYGLDPDLDRQLAWSKGLISLCNECGINHGCFVGTAIPYIWTLDLVLTVHWRAMEHPKCVVVSVKPLKSERFSDIDPISRDLEKLEVERLYCQSLKIPYFVADRTLYSGHLLGQLEWLASAAYTPDAKLQKITMNFLKKYYRDNSESSLSEWIERLQIDYGLMKREADYIIQHCLWHQYIDYDLAKYIDMEKNAIPGGIVLRESLRKTIETGV